jgi:hypothetical protein
VRETRRCRNTFLSLKTTCRKLGITFQQDRIHGLITIPEVDDLIREKAATKTKLYAWLTRRDC